MSKRVRSDLTPEHLASLRKTVFANSALSAELRRQGAKRIVRLPRNGAQAPVDFSSLTVGITADLR